MKKNNFWFLLLLIPFFGGFAVALTECLANFEYAVFSFVNVGSPIIYWPFYIITEIGSAVGVLIITVLLVLVSIFKKKFFSFGFPVALTVIISRIINITLKNLIDRPRPEFKILAASESSFPSGHSQNNMALYIAILLAALLVVNLPKRRLILKVVFISIPVLIGITRIFFGVHYLSDVVAGWSMGALVAVMVHAVYFTVYEKVRNKKNAENRV